jgi:hypothetical protein
MPATRTELAARRANSFQPEPTSTNMVCRCQGKQMQSLNIVHVVIYIIVVYTHVAILPHRGNVSMANSRAMHVLKAMISTFVKRYASRMSECVNISIKQTLITQNHETDEGPRRRTQWRRRPPFGCVSTCRSLVASGKCFNGTFTGDVFA